MVDKENIPQKIDLENADRAPAGDDPQVHFEEDDFSEETKQKIGVYFREKISDDTIASVAAIKNKPNLDAFENPEVHVESEDSYMAKRTSEQRAALDTASNSGFFKRNVVPGNTVDGIARTEIQASALVDVMTELPSFIADEVGDRLSENAMHSPDNRYVGPQKPSEDDAGTGLHVTQTGFGTHAPQKLFTTQQAESAITIKNLRNLGHQILLEASGEIYVPDDMEDIEQVVAARGSTMAVPGLARLGFRIDTSRFGAREILNRVNEDYIKPAVEFDLEGPEKPSFGNVNNPLVPFSAISSGASSVIVGTLLVATFSGIFTALSLLLDDANPKISLASDDPPIAEISRRRLGHYSAEDSGTPNFGLALLGLQENLLIATQNEYSACVREGVKAFFGLDLSGGDAFLGSVGGSATRIVETPGYYNGILRLLVRSISDPLSTIVGGVQDLAGGAGSPHFTKTLADYDPIIGPANDPFTFVESIRLIKESKLLKFMNILAGIGDITLMAPSRSADVSTIDAYHDTLEVTRPGDSGLTEIVPNPAALIRKSRLSDNLGYRFNNSMAWGANTLPSLYLMNTQIQTAEETFAQSYNYSFVATEPNFAQSSNKRLSPKAVTEIENRLDTYYMPFYFHDLRTNEIIAFHAFLDTITDNHKADYNESEGYGRIGKIYSYKNTTRNISLSFKVVAVSKEDFDAMWLKLNKLLMMLYPQYTLGRTISYQNQKFIQPFSQLPSASPMIRMRVGDLIKTNFNEFDLARLFGVGSEHFNVSTARAQAMTRDERERLAAKAKEIRVRQNATPPSFEQGDKVRLVVKVGTVGHRAENRRNRSGSEFIELAGNASLTRLSREQRTAQTERRGAEGRGDIEARTVITIGSSVADRPNVYNVIIHPAPPGLQGNSSFVADFTNANNLWEIVPDHIQAQARAHVNGQSDDIAANAEDIQQNSEDVRTFFSTGDGDTGSSSRASSPSENQASGGGAVLHQGGNPIVKSFESTRGKGLAGFIQSINFNWEGALWETEAANSKAPKWCTITMEFAPVHDLNPGIDVNGNMIAPIYNVGAILQQMKVRRSQAAEEQSENAESAAGGAKTSPGDFGELNAEHGEPDMTFP